VKPLLLALAGLALVSYETFWWQAPRVIDGDTVRMGSVRVRLVGFDAPEIFSPQCPAELDRGLRAKNRLGALLTANVVVRVPCVGKNYGRACGWLPGAASALIREHLAVPYVCSSGHCPRRDPMGWCGTVQRRPEK
jgi:endonuclease YncB( thermonuclease family)